MLMRGTNGIFFPKISGVHKRNCTKQVTSVLDIVFRKIGNSVSFVMVKCHVDHADIRCNSKSLSARQYSCFYPISVSMVFVKFLNILIFYYYYYYY